MPLVRQLLGRQLKVAVQLSDSQKARLSSLSDLVKNVKSTLESSPELKETVEQLQRSAENLSNRTKVAAESAREAVADAAEKATGQARSATGGFSDKVKTDGSGASGRSAASGAGWSGAETSGATGSADTNEEPSGTSSSNSLPRGSGFGARFSRAFSAIRREVEEAVLPRKESVSATRARDPTIRPAGDPGSSAVSIAKQEETRWTKQWAEMQDKLGLHPIFQRLRGFSDNKVFNKGREVAGDLRERWETSESPFVHRIQDMRDSMFTETEQAQALREIRSRYPDFDMVSFVRVLKSDVPVVIRAYLEGNLKTLEEHCAPQMMERFAGIVAAQKAEGLTTDSTILDVSDVELVDLKFVDGDPVVVVQFTCQQINCARDKFGNVVEGGPQDVQRVYYYWALQQDDAGFVGEDGNFHPPRWQLREMMVRGMHNLL